jgi:hypothetical protein
MAYGLSQYIIDRVYLLAVFEHQFDANGAPKPVVVWNQYSRRRIVDDSTTVMRNYYKVITSRKRPSSPYRTVFNVGGDCRWMIHTPPAAAGGDDADDDSMLLTTFAIVTNPMYPLDLAADCLKDLMQLFREQQQHQPAHAAAVWANNNVHAVRGRRRHGTGGTQTRIPWHHRLSWCWWITIIAGCRTKDVRREQQSRLDDLFFTYARKSTTTGVMPTSRNRYYETTCGTGRFPRSTNTRSLGKREKNHREKTMDNAVRTLT